MVMGQTMAGLFTFLLSEGDGEYNVQNERKKEIEWMELLLTCPALLHQHHCRSLLLLLQKSPRLAA